MAFFDSSITASKRSTPSLIPRCGACGLSEGGCISKKIPVSGKGRREILIVSEAPTEDEDRLGQHLSGTSSARLRAVLSQYDLDLDLDCWKTNALICRPIGEDQEQRVPTNDEVDHCRPNLLKAIQELQPKVIIPMGAAAIRSLIAPIWREDVGPAATWVGWQIPSQTHNAWITPTYHPAAVFPAKEAKEGAVVKLWFSRHIEVASRFQGRPWQTVPDYKSQVRIILDPTVAAEWIRDKISKGGAVSFDYETDRLKPDHPDAEIVCCSVCWNGVETIAYPWVGAAVDATRELLVSPLKKIGANIKFEERWSRCKLGVEVVNWEWCGMLSAHHLDCRQGITSVKFQALVRLGFPDWSQSIKPYLESADPSGKNRIREVDLRSLLLYCGIDSLVEFKIAVLQKKEMMSDPII